MLHCLPHPQRPQADQAALLSALGGLWAAGVAIDWGAFYAGQERRRLALPTYPFQRRRYWIDPPGADAAPPRPRRRRAELEDWTYLPYWKPAPAPAGGTLDGPWLLISDRDGLGERLAAALLRQGRSVVTARPGAEFARLGGGAFLYDPDRPEDYRTLLADPAVAPVRRLVYCVTGPIEPYPEAGFLRLLYLLQAFDPATVRSLTVVTRGASDAGNGAPARPASATVPGALAALPQEYPELACRAIDLDPDPAGDPEPAGLLSELAAPEPPLVAWRGRRRWLPAFEAAGLPAAAAPHPRLRSRGHYLLTGGLGGIGLSLARRLAATVQARLTLLGRSPFPPPSRWDAPDLDPAQAATAARLRELEALGAAVLVLQGDVTDPARLAAALDSAEARFGPVHGVIHAAGVAGGGVLAHKTGDQARRVLAPKVRGALALDAVCGDRPLDFMVLCSSLSALLGGYGQTDYCAANAFLDAFAAWRDARGRPTLAIAWDSWRRVGMAAAAPVPEALGRLREQGLETEGLEPEDGAETLLRVLAADLPRVLVSTHDLHERYRHRHRALAEALEELAAAPETRPRHPRPGLSVPFTAPAGPLEELLCRLWEEHLGFTGLGTGDDWFELGGDSLKGLGLVNALQKPLGETVHVAALFEAPSVARLADYLRRHYPRAAARLEGTAADDPAPDRPVTEADLEDLRRRLPRLAPAPAPAQRNPPAVFLLAPPRTGSTLLRVMLAGHPGLFAPPEMALLPYRTLAERRAAAFDPSLLDGPALAYRQLTGRDPGSARAWLARRESDGLSTLALYRELQALAGDRLLVDKSPDTVYDPAVLERAEAEFERPRYLLLLRHPYGMIHSYEDARMDLLLPGSARRDLPWSRRQLAELLWLNGYRNLRAFAGRIAPERRLWLRFEELVSRPREVMEEVCRFLDLDFHEALLDPYADPERRMSGGLQAGARPLGDPKFHSHGAIEPDAAQAWRQAYRADFLGEPTRALAAELGYALLDDDPAAQVAALSDAQVDAALAALLGGGDERP